MLTELVKAGKLPPIDQRVPEQPFVVDKGTLITEKDLPDWQPGKFGGTMNFAHAVANWNPDIFIGDNDNLLCAPGIGLEGLKPCLLSDFKVSPDAKDFTFTLRKGLKWSDGTPVTTEDVRFTLEDMYANDKLFPTGMPNKFRDGGKAGANPVKFSLVDDLTWKLTFGEPYGGLLREISVKGWQGYTDMVNPAKFLKQYLPKYADMNSQAIKDEMTKMNLKDEWWQLFANKRCQNWDLTNPRCVNYPSLYAWVGVPSGNPSLLSFERNPYYWKVDTTGQQLPYVDKLKSQQVNDVEMLTMKVLNGEVDFVRESTGLNKLPLYKENEAKANIKAQLMDNHVDPTALFLNHTFKDENWRKTISDVRFRQAIGAAINYKEIIDNVYYGFAQPPKLVGATYDVAKANKLLDDMGMSKKGADGFRLGLDGKPFVIAFEHGANAPDIAPASELVAQHLKKVGLNMTVKQIDSSLAGTRQAANELQGYMIWDVQPMWADNTWTDYAPGNSWAPLWNLWYTSGGKQGEEPPAAAKALYTIMEGRNQAIPYSDADKKLKDDLYKNYAENAWIFPLAEKVNYAMVASSKLGNMPMSGQAIGADYSMEQFYFK